MTDDSLSPFALPSVSRKKVTAAFDGGRFTSDGGVVIGIITFGAVLGGLLALAASRLAGWAAGR